MSFGVVLLVGIAVVIVAGLPKGSGIKRTRRSDGGPGSFVAAAGYFVVRVLTVSLLMWGYISLPTSEWSPVARVAVEGAVVVVAVLILVLVVPPTGRNG